MTMAKSRSRVVRRPMNPASAPGPVTEPHEVDDVATIAQRLDALEAENRALRVAVAHARDLPTVPTETPPTAGRIADNEELSDWQRSIRERTRSLPPGSGTHGKSYNHPEVWFMKPDGAIVQLQGDPNSCAYYRTKGFHQLLPEEVKHWLSTERPGVLKHQQDKANMINMIRRAVAIDTALLAGLDPSWETDLDRMTVDELRQQLQDIKNTPTADGRPRRLMARPRRLQDADDRRAQAEMEHMLNGVETSGTSMEELEAKLGQARGSGRLLELTPATARTFV